MSKTAVARLLNDVNKGVSQTSGTNGMLARIFREYLVSYKITFDQWERLIREYIAGVAQDEEAVAKERGDTEFVQTKEHLTSLRTNMRNALAEKTMTWPTFVKAMRFLRTKKFTLQVHGTQSNTQKELSDEVTVYVSERELPSGNTDFPDVCLNLLLMKLLDQAGLSRLDGTMWDDYLKVFVAKEAAATTGDAEKSAKSKIGSLRTNLKKKITREATTWPTFVTGLRFLQLSTATITVTIYPTGKDAIVQELIIYIDEEYENEQD